MGERIKGKTLVADDEGDDADGVVIKLYDAVGVPRSPRRHPDEGRRAAGDHATSVVARVPPNLDELIDLMLRLIVAFLIDPPTPP